MNILKEKLLETVSPFYFLKVGESYHNIFHIGRMLDIYIKHRDEIFNKYKNFNEEIFVDALLWHDAGYVPGKKDNEKSACKLYKINNPKYDVKVCELIMSTIPFSSMDKPEEKILHDLDWFAFSDYEQLCEDEKLIEIEYNVSHDLFVKGRKDFYIYCLQNFGDGIFKSEIFYYLNVNAKENIQKRINYME